MLDMMIKLINDSPVFGMRFLRSFKWFLYRKKFKQNKLYVAEKVIISCAHKSVSSSIRFLGEVHIGRAAYIDYSGGVIIGNHVAISENAQIFTHNHTIDGKINWNLNSVSFSNLEIGNYAWVGAGAIILPSVRVIGEGAIIAAGAVLTKDAEALGVYAGNPAKLVRRRIIDETINS